MKFMVAWKIPPGCYKAAVKRFLKTGAPNPTGVRTIGRWHAPGSSSGWHVLEGDAAGVAELEAVCSNGQCVIAQTEHFPLVLKDPNADKVARAEALKFVVHFAGDLHQPLHDEDNGDKGGNFDSQ